MNGATWGNALTLAAVAFAVAWPAAWAAGPPTEFGPWAARLGFLALGLLPACCLGPLWIYRHWQRYQAARRYVEALCQVEPCEIGHDQCDRLPPLPAHGPWSPCLERIREAFREHARQIEDREQARAAAEVRCRRAVTEIERVQAILSGLPEPVLAVDGYDELVLANHSARQLFQLDVENAETRGISGLVQCQRLISLLLGTAHHKTAGNRSEDIELADPAGNPHWFRATVARLGKEGGGEDAADSPSGGAVMVLRDIADQKALQKRNAEFVSSVSHEMKTPLAGIKAYVELLADGDAEDEQTREEFLNVISGQADRLQRLVENLLNLARIEAGVVKVSKQPRSLNAVLEEALHVVQPAAEAKGIALTSDLSPMYLSVLADHDMLLQAAINLLSNAIKYTPSGGRVVLRSRTDEGQARFEVADTGVGLSEEDCQRVFEKFYRVQKSKDMAAGTGLGLPLARHMIEDVHGGRLRVESKLGEGSTFIVTLPSAAVMT
jgi:two-component system phosphate regulon sensor histidine kinase PhoR